MSLGFLDGPLWMLDVPAKRGLFIQRLSIWIILGPTIDSLVSCLFGGC